MDNPDTRSSDAPQLPPQTRREHFRLAPVLRDVTIIFVLTMFGGCVVGAMAASGKLDAQSFVLGIALSNVLGATIGFTICGCLAPMPRWRHLAWVALGVWLTGLINVLFFGVSIPNWIGGIFVVAVAGGAGGGLSYLFKRDEQSVERW